MPGMQCGGDIGFRRPNGGFETLWRLQSGRTVYMAPVTDLEMMTVAFPGAQRRQREPAGETKNLQCQMLFSQILSR